MSGRRRVLALAHACLFERMLAKILLLPSAVPPVGVVEPYQDEALTGKHLISGVLYIAIVNQALPWARPYHDAVDVARGSGEVRAAPAEAIRGREAQVECERRLVLYASRVILMEASFSNQANCGQMPRWLKEGLVGSLCLWEAPQV